LEFVAKSPTGIVAIKKRPFTRGLYYRHRGGLQSNTSSYGGRGPLQEKTACSEVLDIKAQDHSRAPIKPYSSSPALSVSSILKVGSCSSNTGEVAALSKVLVSITISPMDEALFVRPTGSELTISGRR
jgi:hypothetical protein